MGLLIDKSMTDPRVKLKNPVVAAVLGYLIPGAGHWYQGRYFKAAIYTVCILGTFFYGMHLGNWKTVYYKWTGRSKTIGFFAQIGVGLPAMGALIQHKRYDAPQDPFHANHRIEKESSLGEKLEAPFKGRVRFAGEDAVRDIEGQLTLVQDGGEMSWEVNGSLKGTIDGKEPIELELGDPVEVGPQIFASENISFQYLRLEEDPVQDQFASDRRYVMCHVHEKGEAHEYEVAIIEGTVPRAFWDYYQVPIEDDAEQHLNRILGKQMELALVFTWIAGLLNLLAVWDAYEGPAYGYGDEPTEEEAKKKQSESHASKTKEPEAAAAEA